MEIECLALAGTTTATHKKEIQPNGRRLPGTAAVSSAQGRHNESSPWTHDLSADGTPYAK